MYRLIWCLNIINYLILSLLLFVFFITNTISAWGFNVVTFFFIYSLITLVFSIFGAIRFRKESNSNTSFITSIFINLVNLVLVFPLLVIFIF